MQLTRHEIEALFAEDGGGVEEWNRLREAGLQIPSACQGFYVGTEGLAGVDFSALTFTGCEFSFRDLRGANFEGAILVGVHFLESDLEGANFKGADLYWANFSSSNLKGANFNFASLRGAILENANLENANLARADFQCGNIGGGATLKCANLLGTRPHLAYLKDAQYDENTRFPKGFDPVKAGMLEVSGRNQRKKDR